MQRYMIERDIPEIGSAGDKREPYEEAHGLCGDPGGSLYR